MHLVQKWSFPGKENLCQSPLRTFSMRFLWSCKPVRPVLVISAPQGPESCEREFLSVLDAVQMFFSLRNNPHVVPNLPGRRCRGIPSVSSTALHQQVMESRDCPAHTRGEGGVQANLSLQASNFHHSPNLCSEPSLPGSSTPSSTPVLASFFCLFFSISSFCRQSLPPLATKGSCSPLPQCPKT